MEEAELRIGKEQGVISDKSRSLSRFWSSAQGGVSLATMRPLPVLIAYGIRLVIGGGIGVAAER